MLTLSLPLVEIVSVTLSVVLNGVKGGKTTSSDGDELLLAFYYIMDLENVRQR